MSKLTKNQKIAEAKVDFGKQYRLGSMQAGEGQQLCQI